MAQGRVTIKQVAAAAGVSITTVSHVLNDVPGKRITPDTRERVLAEAARLGYAPNILAQSLRTQRSHTIGLIGDEIATTPFAGQDHPGCAGCRHCAATPSSSSSTPATERDVEEREIDELLRRQVDGILYAAMYHRAGGAARALAGVPTVLINASCTDAGRRRGWCPTRSAGGEDAAEVLLAAGHRAHRVHQRRRRRSLPRSDAKRASVDAPRHAGLAQADLQVVTAESRSRGRLPGGTTPAWTAATGRPAIFCFNDRLAMGVYRAAAELRPADPARRVDRRFRQPGLHRRRASTPGLTTIELPHYDMGVWAAEQLFDQISTRTRLRTAAPTTRHPGAGHPPALGGATLPGFEPGRAAPTG